MDQFENADDLKNNFFYKYLFKHINIVGKDSLDASNWPEGFLIEESFYVNDGSKYGIGEKITDYCDYDVTDIKNNIPCFIIHVDVNGDRKPNKVTNNELFYKDINLYYVYSDRIVMQPGNIEAPEETHDIPGGGGGDTPGGGGGDTPGGGGGDDTPSGDDGNGHTMSGCLGKQHRTYESCLKFCQQNHYNSRLCD